MSVSGSPGAGPYKFPMWRTIGDAYAVVFGNLGVFLSLAALPIIFSFAIRMIHFAGTGRVVGQPTEGLTFGGWYYSALLLNALIWAVFAVSWHRFVLLEGREGTGPVQFHVERREAKFFLYGLLFMVPSLVMTLLSNLILTSNTADPSVSTISGLLLALVLAFVVPILLLVVWIRCLFLFPAIAVDSDKDLRAAWAQTRGVFWRLAGATFITSIPFGVLIWALIWIHPGMSAVMGINPEVTWTSVLVYEAPSQVLTFLFAATIVSIASLAFRRQTGWTPASSTASQVVTR